MMVNPAYREALGCMFLGGLSVLAALTAYTVLASNGQFGFTRSKIAQAVWVPVLGGLGAVLLLAGCCACCTLQKQTSRNWSDSLRRQRSHNISLGSSEDPASQAQPILSGYDPRKTPLDSLRDTRPGAWEPD